MGAKKVALTCGDPAGVGPEVAERLLAARPELAQAVCLVGPPSWLERLPGVEGVPVGEAGFRAVPGKPSEAGAHVAFEALETAARGCRGGRFAAAVTGPVSKTWMQRVGFHFPGQTEFFADRWSGEPTMAFGGGRMRVVLATWHIPLMSVAQALTSEVLERAVRRAVWLARALGAERPRVGVCGLNPHAGEDGILGREEMDFLNPELDRLRREFPGLSRCEPPDTVFWRHLQGEFDAVVALYHDQGLGPLKTLDFENSVNITLGLPWVRTSPDHGTAFGIAGQGKANFSSMEQALMLAQKLAAAGPCG